MPFKEFPIMNFSKPYNVRQRVEEIRAKANDDEAAHCMEDELHKGVLEAIANGATCPIELAHEALQTLKIEFARWCA